MLRSGEARPRDEPIVLVLDDLHWADVPTLRVLRLLLGDRSRPAGCWCSPPGARHPEPTGALADVAEALARRHAARLALDRPHRGRGRGGRDRGRRGGARPGSRPTSCAARTDGNPFFLVEYARLAQEGGDLAALMTDADPPTAVSDVLARRLERLPEESRSLLRWAAVIGREFELPSLAEAAAVNEDDVLDRLDPALEAGLLREDGIGRYLFGHALVRDSVYTGFSPTRRARAHARVAAVLEQYADRETEVARHWLAAGPGHAAGPGSRPGRGRVVRTRHAYGTAAELLVAALDGDGRRPARTLRDRYRLLMELADAYRWAADWMALLDVATEAIAVATELDDVRLLARAGSCMTKGALWQSPAHGADHPVVIAALRRCLEELPDTERAALPGDARPGRRGLLHESAAEREALVEEAIALARRIGDDALLVHACQIGFVATWRPGPPSAASSSRWRPPSWRRDRRRARLGRRPDPAPVVHGELGQVTEMWAGDRRPRRGAPAAPALPAVVLEALFVPWLAEDGRFEEAEELITCCGPERAGHCRGPGRGGRADLDPDVEGPGRRGGRGAGGRGRRGAADGRRRRDHDVPRRDGGRGPGVRGRPTSSTSTRTTGSPCSTGAARPRPPRAGGSRPRGRGVRRLAPYAGHSGCAGSGTTLGPVDAFLAQAAAAVGEHELAGGTPTRRSG